MATGLIDRPQQEPQGKKSEYAGRDVFRAFTSDRVKDFSFDVMTPNWGYEQIETEAGTEPKLDSETIRVMAPVLASVIKAGEERGDADQYMYAYLEYVRDQIENADVPPERGSKTLPEYNEEMKQRYTSRTLKHTAVVLERIVKAALKDGEEGSIMSSDSVLGMLDFARDGGIKMDDFVDELPLENIMDEEEKHPSAVDTQVIQILSVQALNGAVADGQLTQDEANEKLRQLKTTAGKLIEHIKSV